MFYKVINKKNIYAVFFLFFISSNFLSAQDVISLSFHQDFKLLAFSDDHGNKPGTLDLITRLKYEGKECKIGFWTAGMEFEKATIKDGFSRYGALVGYTFTTFFDDPDFHIEPSIGFGNIVRRNISSASWSGSIQTCYKLNDFLKISSLFQFTERSDLEIAYGDKVTRYSFFIGVEINLFRFKR